VPSCALYQEYESAFSSHQEGQPKVRSASVPRPCQNGRKTAVARGHSRAPRTASDLDKRRLTRCVKRPS
jgi:hypothetical protein